MTTETREILSNIREFFNFMIVNVHAKRTVSYSSNFIGENFEMKYDVLKELLSESTSLGEIFQKILNEKKYLRQLQTAGIGNFSNYKPLCINFETALMYTSCTTPAVIALVRETKKLGRRYSSENSEKTIQNKYYSTELSGIVDNLNRCFEELQQLFPSNVISQLMKYTFTKCADICDCRSHDTGFMDNISNFLSDYIKSGTIRKDYEEYVKAIIYALTYDLSRFIVQMRSWYSNLYVI